jgi:hypothetical protein
MSKSKPANTPIPPTPVPQQAPSVKSFTSEISEDRCSDEDDFELLIGFNLEYAKNRLFTLPNSITLAIE